MKHLDSVLQGGGSKHLPALVAAGFAILGIASVGMAMPANAYADVIGKVSCPNGNHPRSSEVSSVEKAIKAFDDMISTSNNKMQETKVSIDLYCDWNTKDYGRITIPKGIELTVNLNGHMIDRGLASANWSGEGSGEVFIVKKNAKLIVNGGSSSISHPGTLSDNDHFWKSDINGSTSIYGGLITGAANDDTKAGGAITMSGDNSKVVLNNVTLAGNVRDNWGIEHNDGAGVAVEGDNSTLELNNASIIYNHAEGYGGGINVEGNDSTVTIAKGSKVNNNYTAYSGGGIHHHGKNGTVTISGDSQVSFNAADQYGGGIYDYYNGTKFVLDNSEISSNTTGSAYEGGLGPVNEGRGGGVYLNDVATLTLKNGATISENKANAGAGVYVCDDDTAVKLESRSKIEKNVAGTMGGGVFMDDDGDTIHLSGQSSINNNEAGISGGGVCCESVINFTGTDQTIQLEGKSSIQDNKASQGAGIFVAFGTIGCNLAISSSDATGLVTGNSGGNGAGVHIRGGKVALEGVTVKNNAVTGNGGGVLQDSGTLILKGKVNVTENTAGAVKNNIAFSDPLRTDSANPISADSRIGVSYFRDTEEDMPLAEEGFLEKIGDKFEDVVIPDNLRRSAAKDQSGRLFLIKKNSSPTVTIYGASEEPTYERVEYESTHTLDSSKFQKSGYVLDYWIVDSDISDGKLVPNVDGKVSFKMPGRDITIRAHYARPVASMQLTMRQDLTWDQLGDDPEDASVSFVRLYDADGNNYGTGTAADAKVAFTTTSINVKDLGNGQKKATYTVRMRKSGLESFGMCYVDGQFKQATAEVRADYNTAAADDVEVKADADGSLVIKVTVILTNPEATVTIDAVNVNKASDDSVKAFDTVVQDVADLKFAELSDDGADSAVKTVVASAGDEADTASDADQALIITAPDEPGWEFKCWDKLPDGVIEDAQTHQLTLTSHIAVKTTKLTAEYTPLASSVAIEVAAPKPGEEFPTRIKSCVVSGAKEIDVTDRVKGDIKATWTLEDGTPVDETAQAGVTYKVNLHANGSQDSYIFGMNSSVYTTVNGLEPYSCEYDAGSKTGSIVYYTQAAEDDSYDGLLYEYQDENIYMASDIADNLPARACYKLKNGEVLSAPVEWDTSWVDQTQQYGSITVYGIFEDDNGDEHQVSMTFNIVGLGAPVATYAKSENAGAQTVSLTQGDGWDGNDVKVSMHYRAYNEGEIDGTAIDRSTFADYTVGTPVEIKNGQLLAAYAVVEFANGVTKDTGLDFYGCSLEDAQVSVNTAGTAYAASGATPAVTVTLNGTTLAEGKDYSVDYRHSSKVGKASVTVMGNSSFYSGEKTVSFKVKPAKVKGVKAKAKGKKKAVLSWNKHNAQTDGFQVRYAASKAKLAKNEGKAAKVKNAGAKSYTAKKLKSGKKYFFKVRAYKVVDGKTYWSAWSKVKAAKAK